MVLWKGERNFRHMAVRDLGRHCICKVCNTSLSGKKYDGSGIARFGFIAMTFQSLLDDVLLIARLETWDDSLFI